VKGGGGRCPIAGGVERARRGPAGALSLAASSERDEGRGDKPTSNVIRRAATVAMVGCFSCLNNLERYAYGFESLIRMCISVLNFLSSN
jgi:hypothetical protein